tara:strand:+ start:401 stop:805 length:405 start_codon:yes stop_codon:yes gene_type:complete
MIYKSFSKIPIGSERNFGFVFSFVFMLIFLYFSFYKKDFHLWLLIVSIVFLFLSIFKPTILKLPNKVWFRFGLLLGSIISPITMGIIFFLTVTPTGLIMRLLGKDILNKRKNNSAKSYWIKKKNVINHSMKNQF